MLDSLVPSDCIALYQKEDDASGEEDYNTEWRSADVGFAKLVCVLCVLWLSGSKNFGFPGFPPKNPDPKHRTHRKGSN
jgi:hypothetical protein